MIDFINIGGQILIGFGLIVGLFSRYAAWAGALLLLLYYVALPPTALGNLFIDRNASKILNYIKQLQMNCEIQVKILFLVSFLNILF